MSNTPTQPKALRLALSISLMDTFTNYQQEELDKAADELRRLHALTTTQGTQPTDDEIEAAWTEATGSSFFPYPNETLAFARTVLAKWGTPQPVVREPLTDEQLWANDEIMSLNADLGWHMDTIRMFTRVIERAHGIKGGQHGAE